MVTIDGGVVVVIIAAVASVATFACRRNYPFPDANDAAVEGGDALLMLVTWQARSSQLLETFVGSVAL